jgi:sorting nexin-25
MTILPGQGLVKSIYKSLTSGFDEVLGTAPATIMDTVIQRLSQQAAELSKMGGAGVQDEDLVGRLNVDGPSSPRLGERDDGDGSPSWAALQAQAQGSANEGLTYFTAPICDLFVTLFALKEKNNWLRRQAILIILQQVLGGTIERKFRDGVQVLLGPEQLIGYITALKNGLWPNGQPKPKERPRTAAEKAATRDLANRKLSALMPGKSCGVGPFTS